MHMCMYSYRTTLEQTIVSDGCNDMAVTLYYFVVNFITGHKVHMDIFVACGINIH